VEHRLHAKNGEYRWHLNRAKPLLDEHGKACQWYGSSTDVHLQKEAELALPASEAEFRASFENASVGMVPVDAASGVFFRVNASFCALTQYSESVLASMSFKDLLDPNNRESDHRTLMAMVHGEQWDNQNEKKVHP
jgi:PAS domain-containing protein